MFRNRRRGVQSRSHEYFTRQGGTQPLARAQTAQSRGDDESRRSSARRRRRPDLGRTPSGDALGQADEGQKNPDQQIHRQIHRDLASQEQEEGLIMARSIWKGPFVDADLINNAGGSRYSAFSE